MLKLYDYFRSSASFRVRIALNIKKLSHEIVPVHLVKDGGEQHTKTYTSINPQSLLPTLTEGNRILTQSLAIIEYLDETHPTPALLPDYPYDKAKVRAFAYAIACDIHPVNNLRVLKYLQDQFKITDEQKQEWYQHWIKLGFNALEEQLRNYDNHSTYCFGESPTLADICLVPQMYNARRFNVDLSNYPLLCAIDENCQKLDAFTNAWPVEETQ